MKKATNSPIGSTYYQDSPLGISFPETGLLKILMLEDNQNDADLIQMYLRSSKFKFEISLISSKEEYIEKLTSEEYDVILSDHNLPGFSSLEALRFRNEVKFHIPFILVTGAIPEEYAVTILQEGANDYILKDRPQRLLTAITEAIKKQKNVAEKIRAEQELITAHERLKLVGKATADAIWDWNLLTEEVFFGEGFELLFGYKLSETTADIKFWSSCIHPEAKYRVQKSLHKAIKGKTTNWVNEYQFIRADGSVAIVLDKGIILRDDNGKAIRMVGAMQDLTHVRQLERELNEQNLQHQKRNTEIAIQSQEEERRYIGKELHDNITQLMATAKMMLEMARRTPDMEELCLDKSQEAIIMAIDETRKLSHAMVPPVFDHKNTFLTAVNDIITDTNLANDIQVFANIDLEKGKEILNEKISLTFYRIIQVQLNNILKHAKATKVDIAFTIVNNFYQLIISDNGVGFDPEKNTQGIGLKNIKNRVDLCAGTMEIITKPGHGCSLKVEIPVA